MERNPEMCCTEMSLALVNYTLINDWNGNLTLYVFTAEKGEEPPKQKEQDMVSELLG